MPWWAWLIFGTCLVGAELLLIDAGFYLVCIGAIALLVGLGDLAGFPATASGEWAVFGIATALSLVLIRDRIDRRFRDRLPGGDDGAGAD